MKGLFVHTRRIAGRRNDLARLFCTDKNSTACGRSEPQMQTYLSVLYRASVLFPYGCWEPRETGVSLQRKVYMQAVYGVCSALCVFR